MGIGTSALIVLEFPFFDADYEDSQIWNHGVICVYLREPARRREPLRRLSEFRNSEAGGSASYLP
jgi:hypothetical protein